MGRIHTIKSMTWEMSNDKFHFSDNIILNLLQVLDNFSMDPNNSPLGIHRSPSESHHDNGKYFQLG